jgi:hypothetical protein
MKITKNKTILTAAITLALATQAAQTTQAAVVTSIVGADTLSVNTSATFDGAINSVTFRGVQYLNSSDPGRLLQSAVSFDGYGECLNPTEGGSWYGSTSVLKSTVKIGTDKLWTISQMAYWLRPGEAYGQPCGDTQVTSAVNTTALSNVLLEKQLDIGMPGFPNVISHRVTYNILEPHTTATFEASTGYLDRLTPTFGGKFMDEEYYNPVTRVATPVAGVQGEQQYPVIIHTRDQSSAMGVFSPDLPQNWNGALVGYGAFNFLWAGVNKFNCVFREKNVRPKSYTYQCMVVVGTLAEVENTISALYAKYK